MSKHYTYRNQPFPGAGYDTSLTLMTTPDTFGQQFEVAALYDNGIFKQAFGDISGSDYVNGALAVGSSDPTVMPNDPDILYMGTDDQHNILIYDEETTTSTHLVSNDNGVNYFNLYGTGRYGLPTDLASHAIEVIEVGQNQAPVGNQQVDHSHNSDANLISLDYNAANGGVAYNFSTTIIGGPGRDIILGGEAADLIYGGDEHLGLGDGIWGGGGGDTIYGGSDWGNVNGGADDIYGYSGNDLIYGGSNGDVYYGDAGSDVMYGATSGGTALTLTVTDTAAKVTTIFGNEGTFFGGFGNDTMYASTAVDGTQIGSSQFTTEFFFGGNPSSLWNDARFVQTANSTTAAGTDLFAAGDTITPTLDVVSYANANTSVLVDFTLTNAYQPGTEGAAVPNGTQVATGAGAAVNDIFYGIEGIIGGTNNDRLAGDAKANYFSGLGGNDTLTGRDGADTLYGGLGIDTLFGGNDNDSLDGGGGGDSVFGEGGSDIIAYANDIPINGTGNNDSLLFNNSETSLSIAITTPSTTASDLLDGGANFDSLVLTATNDVLVVNRDDLTIDGVVGPNVPNKIAGFEFIDGGLGNDIIALNDAGGAVYGQSVTVAGGLGNDLIATGSGNDTIFAGTLGDSTSANPGGDTLYGGGGADLIYGSSNDDTISGGTGGMDTLFGGASNDLFFARADGTPGGNTTGWDGVTGSTGIVTSVGTRYQSLDSIEGGVGTDTLNLDDTANNPGVGAYYNAYQGGVLELSRVEIIVATALADIVNLTNGSNAAYTADVSIFAGNGDDFVFSGSGNDYIAGDAQNTLVSSRNDTLFGGDGTDTIFGDSDSNNPLLGGSLGGDDKLFGGNGDDTVFGGAGNDAINDVSTGIDLQLNGVDVDTSIDGGDGNDVINASFGSDGVHTGNTAVINGGANKFLEGNDTVFTTGTYAHVTSNLGGNDDLFVGAGYNGVGSGGIDIVDGQNGNDAIAGWLGNDTLSGGSGEDALWGGAGVDTIFGGDGDDYIYPGQGGANIMYGGNGDDGYFLERSSGAGNQIYDTVRNNTPGEPSHVDTVSQSYLIVQADFAFNEAGANPDYLVDSQGVHESDGDIMNGTGDVQIVSAGSHLWTLNVISGVGAGSTSVTFDDRDILQIGLINNTASHGPVGTQVFQFFAGEGMGGLHPTDGYYLV